MPAIPREIEQAMEEGIIIHEHRGVQRLVLRGEQVIGLELVHSKELADTTGKARLVSFEGTESLLHVEQVIPAIGQTVDPHALDVLASGSEFLVTGEHGRISGHPGLYTGGDTLGGQGTVSAAIGDGRLDFDVAPLGHVELYSDKFEETLDFFTRVYGLTKSERKKGQAWGRKTIESFHTHGTPPLSKEEE